MKETKETKFTSKKLDMSTVGLFVITGASFSNVKNLRSQLGYVIIMMHSSGASYLVHYGSIICRIVTRSILATENHALVLYYDNDFVIRDTFNEIWVEV